MREVDYKQQLCLLQDAIQDVLERDHMDLLEKIEIKFRVYQEEQVVFENSARFMAEYVKRNAEALALEKQNATAPVALNATGIVPPPLVPNFNEWRCSDNSK